MVSFTAYFVGTKYGRATLDTAEYMAGMALASALTLTPIALLSGQAMTTDDGRTWLLVGAMFVLPGTAHVNEQLRDEAHPAAGCRRC